MTDENKNMLAVVSDFRQTFDTPHGKKVLLYLMKRTGFMSTSYVEGDMYTTAFNEGQRALVVEIMKKLKIDIKKLEQTLMQEEGDRDDVI